MMEFNFSETYIKKRLDIVLITFFVCAFLIIGFGLYLTSFDLEGTVIISGIVILQMAVIFAIEVPLIFRSLRKMKVVVLDDKIIKQCGKKEQIALWSDMVRVKIKENVKGGVENIKLFHKKNKKILLFGFNDMDKIAELIGENVNENVLVQRKRYKIDWNNNPMVLITTMLVTGLVLGMVHYWGLMDYFIPLFLFGVGIMLLVWGPMRKTNVNMKWIEIIVGVILIICCILCVV